MEINRPGFNKPIDPAAAEKTNAAEKSGKFEERMKAGGGVHQTSASTASATLERLKERFSKRDLEDKTKVESLINSAIDEVLLSGPATSQLPAGGRKAVADVMAGDPTIREKMLNLLRKTLV